MREHLDSCGSRLFTFWSACQTLGVILRSARRLECVKAAFMSP